MQTHAVDSRYAWGRLVVALMLMTIGSSAMYVVAVVLPSVQAEFGTARADASLPYTLLMVGFGIGGVFMGRLADRRGIVLPLSIGAAGLGIGFVAAGLAGSIWTFAINNASFDIGVMPVAGLLAYLLEENGFPITPLILGVVLGGMLEENFISSMIKADGNVLAFFSRPIAAALGALTIAIWFWPVVRRRRRLPEAATL